MVEIPTRTLEHACYLEHLLSLNFKVLLLCKDSVHATCVRAPLVRMQLTCRTYKRMVMHGLLCGACAARVFFHVDSFAD